MANHANLYRLGLTKGTISLQLCLTNVIQTKPEQNVYIFEVIRKLVAHLVSANNQEVRDAARGEIGQPAVIKNRIHNRIVHVSSLSLLMFVIVEP